MAARTLRCLRGIPVARLARGRLRLSERPQQHGDGDHGYEEVRDQVRRVVHRRVDKRVPPFGEGGGEEDDARDEVAGEAGQHRDDGAKDRSPRGGREEPGEPQHAEGQRVVEYDLHWVQGERLYRQVKQAVRRPRDDANPGPLPQRKQDQGHHLERDRTPERHGPDLDQTQHERQGYGERRLREHPGVSERVQRTSSFAVSAGMREESVEAPCAGITRIRFNGSASLRTPSQPRGSPVCRPLNVSYGTPTGNRPAHRSPSTVAASVMAPLETFSRASSSGNSTTRMNSVGSGRGPPGSRTARHRNRWQTSVVRPVLVWTETRYSSPTARKPVSSMSSRSAAPRGSSPLSTPP